MGMMLDYYPSDYAELKALYKLVEHDFLTKRLIHHNWNHVLRDLAKGIMIGEVEGANMKIVVAGVSLHDIGRLYPEEGDDHHASGAKVAPRPLTKRVLHKTRFKR